MSRGAFVGCTDYSHQSLDDVLGDLEEEASRIELFLEVIGTNLEKSKAASYWDTKVPMDFQIVTARAMKQFNTAQAELHEIAREAARLVEEHHCRRLFQVADAAKNIYRDIGIAWHQRYDSKEYGTEDFVVVETIYADLRSIAGNLLDVSNMAGRLEDFVGRDTMVQKSNPWVSGTFYLFAALLLLAAVGGVANLVSWYAVPIVLIAGTLLLVLVGSLQLRNDGALSEAGFVTLVRETFKRLPLLRK